MGQATTVKETNKLTYRSLYASDLIETTNLLKMSGNTRDFIRGLNWRVRIKGESKESNDNCNEKLGHAKSRM